ncbi:MAG: hypothetical protein WBQ32_01780 [Ignavibacteriaceae bacterium]
MKKILTYLMILIGALILFSCDKPAPTQLVDDTNNELEVELLNKNLDDQYYNSGADTSGITQDLTGVTNLISVSGIKITNNKNQTFRLSLAQAMFFDKSKPIRYSDGRILAYETVIPGMIKFNGIEARLDTFKIRYRDLNVTKVAILGQKYVLYNLFLGIPDPFYFDYESNVSFDFDPSGPGTGITFNLPTPPEITGNVILSGRRVEKNLEVVLKWNPENLKRISVIVGLIRPNQISSIPVYRMKTSDDGELRIPARYLNQLPLERFEKIVFTFVRSFEGYHTNGNNDLLVSSQSIHSIVIDIP